MRERGRKCVVDRYNVVGEKERERERREGKKEKKVKEREREREVRKESKLFLLFY